jgi:hypothetical protein
VPRLFFRVISPSCKTLETVLVLTQISRRAKRSSHKSSKVASLHSNAV